MEESRPVLEDRRSYSSQLQERIAKAYLETLDECYKEVRKIYAGVPDRSKKIFLERLEKILESIKLEYSFDRARAMGIREQLGLTQKKLADLIGVKQQTISTIERTGFRRISSRAVSSYLKWLKDNDYDYQR